MWVQMPESVNPSLAQKVAEGCFLLGSESSILLLSFGSPIQVNILVRHIQITTPKHRFPFKSQLPQILLQSQVPLLSPIPQSIKPLDPRVRHIGANQDKLLKKGSDTASLEVMLSRLTEIVPSPQKLAFKLGGNQDRST